MRIGRDETDPDEGGTIVLDDVPWESLDELLGQLGPHRARRIAYDHGTLEIRKPTFGLNGVQVALSAMVTDAAKKFVINMMPGGSTTLLSPDRRRAVEPDACYWTANERVVREISDLDLSVHPPPDLVLDFRVRQYEVDRRKIFAALGIAEMWVYDEDSSLTAWKKDGWWNRIDYSGAFPMLRPQDLTRFLPRLDTDGYTKVILDYNAWLRTLPT